MIQIQLYSKRLLLPLCFLAVVAIQSCKVTLVPPYDAEIATQMDDTAKTVDKFYLSMLETTFAANDGRAFTNFSAQYVDVEVELNSLLSKNKIRPLNEHSTRICEIALQLWQKYKEEHKTDNTLTDGLIKLNQMTLADLFLAMQVAERGKNIVNNPSQ